MLVQERGRFDDVAKQGLWTTRPPIGYVRVVDDLGKSNLAPDPDRSPFVRTAFELVAKGTTAVEDVRKQLITEGLRTQVGRCGDRGAAYLFERDATGTWVDERA